MAQSQRPAPRAVSACFTHSVGLPVAPNIPRGTFPWNAEPQATQWGPGQSTRRVGNRAPGLLLSRPHQEAWGGHV